MSPRFAINYELLAQARYALAGRDKLYWVLGGAGAGKTTICQALQARYHLPVYDMDAQIYGSYHPRFTAQRHPVNKAWSSAENGLAWLLEMSWEQFNAFNQAALPEYLDLLVEDLQGFDPQASLLIDGGICNPGLLVQVLPPRQLVCLAGLAKSSAEIWEAGERAEMKIYTDQLPDPEAAWQKFLEFDQRITQTLLDECLQHQITICARAETETVEGYAQRVASALSIESGGSQLKEGDDERT